MQQTALFQDIFLNNRPLMDVRAPIEYKRGAFPNSTNCPLLDDEQRHTIGTAYKQQGQEAAIALGYQLATDDIKAHRINQWRDFIDQHTNGLLYCFRGGLRSRISQQWIKESGIDYPYIPGGYKAMRQYLIEQLERYAASPAYVIGGLTGTRKTVLLASLPHSINLEGRAHHRGSSFGARIEPQPSPIDFENTLAIDLLRWAHAGHRCYFIEDEGNMIGQLSLPLPLRQAILRSPILIIEDSLEHRAAYLYEEYVGQSYPQYLNHYGTEIGHQQFSQYLLTGIDRIKKRLGGARHQQMRMQIESALDHGDQAALKAHFMALITEALTHYYDPMYRYQIENKKARIAQRGSYHAIQQFCEAQR